MMASKKNISVSPRRTGAKRKTTKARPKVPRSKQGAAEDWLGDEHLKGQGPGRPKKPDALRRTGKPLQVYLPPELHKQAKVAALQADLTVSEWVAQAIEAAL